MTLKDRGSEITQWVQAKFPEDRLVVRAHGRTLTIAEQAADGALDPLVRIPPLGPQLFGLGYRRHTGRWAAMPPLQGPWVAVRPALADDPMGVILDRTPLTPVAADPDKSSETGGRSGCTPG